jgi:hypothetical protein
MRRPPRPMPMYIGFSFPGGDNFYLAARVPTVFAVDPGITPSLTN